jgi:hypothetical protein
VELEGEYALGGEQQDPAAPGVEEDPAYFGPFEVACELPREGGGEEWIPAD